MKICLLTLEWPPYGCGIATYMFNLARGLTRLSHNVTVITNNKEPLACSRVKIIQVPLPDTKRTLWHRIQKWRMEPYHTWSLRAYKKFKELCEKEEFDIIETAEFGAWGRHFVGQSGIPVVVRCHNPTHVVWSINQILNDSYRKPLWLNFQDKYERWQTYHADAIVAPSHALANHLSLSWVIPRSRFTVLPNPIDTELFCPSQIDNKDKKEILYVGRLEYNKGVFDLAKAVKPLLTKYADVNIRFVGMDVKSPEKLKRYGNMASDVIRSLIPCEYHRRLFFTSHVPVTKIVSFQQRAMCTIMPTRGFESFSYTVLEPMACGCPVVATHCGGPTEIIEDGIDGLLVSPGKPKELEKAIERLFLSGDLRKSVAKNAREKVLNKYSIDVVIPQIVQHYERIILNFN